MTFNQAKKRLDTMSQNEFDKINIQLLKLYKENVKQNKDAADAIELAATAMLLYCKR